MLTRTLISMMAGLFLIAGSVAHAKVSPALDVHQHSGAQQLQQLIDDAPYRGLCKLERARASDSIVGMADRSPFSRNVVDEACQSPAPKPDIFENIAHAV